MSDTAKLLINVLLDQTALWADRHDAALDLSEYNEDQVVAALLTVACNPNEEQTIIATCGESLGLIWIQRKQLDLNSLYRLTDAAKSEALAVINHYQPTWISDNHIPFSD